MKTNRLVVVLAGALLLAACGGGGSGGGGSGSGPQISLTFNPTQVGANYYSGESPSADLSVTAGGDLVSTTVYVYVEDRGAVLRTPPDISQTGAGQYAVHLDFSPTLAPGRHRGSLIFKLCADTACRTVYGGAPRELPYDITVTASTNLTALRPLAGAGDWTTFGGSSSHTGYVPVSLDPSAFSPRWVYRYPDSTGATRLGLPVASGGQVFVSVNQASGSPGKDLVALNDSDGSVYWRNTLPWTIYEKASNPALLGGRLYVVGSDNPARLLTVDATNGTLLAQATFSSQFWDYNTPAGLDGKIYVSGGTYTALNRFDATTGALDWSSPGSVCGSPAASPAIDESHLYVHCSDRLELADLDGENFSYISDTGAFSSDGGPSLVATALSGGRAFTVVAGHVSAFQLADSSLLWTVPGSYSSNAAIRGNTVYLSNRSPLRIEARSAVDGTLTATWVPPAGTSQFIGDLIVTNNLLFVSTDRRVYAVSLSTGAIVWTYQHPGRLALSSSGLLYIQRTDDSGFSDGSLVAINLQ